MRRRTQVVSIESWPCHTEKEENRIIYRRRNLGSIYCTSCALTSHGGVTTVGRNSKAYDMAGERGPGNPLFPTSFARLTLGPTLTAKYVFFLLLVWIPACRHDGGVS